MGSRGNLLEDDDDDGKTRGRELNYTRPSRLKRNNNNLIQQSSIVNTSIHFSNHRRLFAPRRLTPRLATVLCHNVISIKRYIVGGFDGIAYDDDEPAANIVIYGGV